MTLAHEFNRQLERGSIVTITGKTRRRLGVRVAQVHAMAELAGLEPLAPLSTSHGQRTYRYQDSEIPNKSLDGRLRLLHALRSWGE